MANPTAMTEMVALTIDSRTKKVADNVSNSNVILKTLEMSGNNKTFTGGTSITEAISFAENKNVQSYSGGELLNTGSSETMGAAQYLMKLYAVAVTMFGEERLKNSGPEAIIDMVAERVKLAEVSLRNQLVRDLYADGTGNNGKNITGLQAAIPLANTTGVYGGIDRAVVPVWRNKSINTTSTGLGAATSANILAHFYNIWAQLQRGNDVPNLIVVDTQYWQLFQSSLQPLQRFASPEKGEAGFLSLKFQSADVVMDSVDTGIAAKTAYFLNTAYLRWRPHADRNFVSLGKRISTNQDADTQFLAWAGNLTCMGQKFQGIVQN